MRTTSDSWVGPGGTSNVVHLSYRFVPPGAVAETAAGVVYVDVGNDFGPGVFDHHQGNAPTECTARLALAHPEYARSQLLSEGVHPRLTVVTHRFPDLDATSAIYILRALLEGQAATEALARWAAYVCEVDAGHTRLRPGESVTPYALFMVRTGRARREAGTDPDAQSLAMLQAGLSLIDVFLAQGIAGEDRDSLSRLRSLHALQTEIAEVEADRLAYAADIARAEIFPCTLPRHDGGVSAVSGLWIEFPGSQLFKAWARGDRAHSGGDGFVFTAVRVGEARYIISVDPASGVSLAGLGEALEVAEEGKRREIGQPRTGVPRQGYRSPDPWYDGRAPLHAFTIVDSPRMGTVLTSAEVREIVDHYCVSRRDTG